MRSFRAVAALCAVFTLFLAACSSTTSDEGSIGGDTLDVHDVSLFPDTTEDTGSTGSDGYSKPDGFRPPDVAAGEFGAPCLSNSDCNSGWCVAWDEGYICTERCLQTCAEGWQCRSIRGTYPDVVFVCFPESSHLCQPCATDYECAGGYCLDVGGEQRCTRPCVDDEDCPSAYTCEERASAERPSVTSTQCVPRSGSCTCGPVNVGEERTCYESNEFGTCWGNESCEEDGWTGCSALVPAGEVCNGVDDDCDGITDNPSDLLPPTDPCLSTWTPEEGEPGEEIVCQGLWNCSQLGMTTEWRCEVQEAGPEVCDYVDNDCDGETDEGFVDAESGRYLSPEHCGGCGIDCQGLIRDAYSTECALVDDVPHCRVVECRNGYYVPNGHDDICIEVGPIGNCSPCSADADCAALDGACVELEGDQYCAQTCAGGEECPPDFTCNDDELCVPTSGSCRCLTGDEGLTRACFRTNDSGTCIGQETCDPTAGWLGCDARTPAAEVCNGIDDDCDGAVDLEDGIALPSEDGTCTRDNEFGGCSGNWQCGDSGAGSVEWYCDAREPAAESCNGVDDDCDGQTDEDFVDPELGLPLEQEHCGACGVSCEGRISNAAETACELLDGEPGCVVVRCDPGYYNAQGRACLGAQGNPCQACGEDGDCPVPGDRCLDLDGGRFCGRDCSADNAYGSPEGECPSGFECATLDDGARQCQPLSGSCSCLEADADATRRCETSNGFGTCAGSETCAPASGWFGCDAPAPAAEVCDGADNDCDGAVDEDVDAPAQACETTWTDPDSGDVATCTGDWVCPRDGGAVSWTCTAPQAGPDICDYLDNDCDGAVDEDFPLLYDLCTVGQGACRRFGFWECAQGGADVACNVDPGPSTTEICDSIDNDCDGAVDESAEWMDLGESCVVGVGACSNGGVKVCDPAAPEGPTVCSAQPRLPGDEVCNGVDDDCDGGVDEDWPDKNTPCTAGLGICARSGVYVCDGAAPTGPVVCDAVPGVGNDGETCDYQDDDCDGQTDEGFQTSGRYTTAAHCGGCGIDCNALWPDGPAAVHAQPFCDATNPQRAPFCSFSCDDQWVDADGVVNNGCELFADPEAIFVAAPSEDSSSADTTGCGTWDAPCATIGYGLARAAANPTKVRVLVADGAYEETVTLVEGIDLIGGYHHTNWQRSWRLNVTSIFGTETIDGHAVTVVAHAIDAADTRFEGFHVYGQLAETPSANSYAIRVTECDDHLTIRDNRVFGGYGAPGAPGAAGLDGEAGPNGADGALPFDTGQLTCTLTGDGGGAAGVHVCGGTDVSGGAGASPACPVERAVGADAPSQPDGASAPSGGGAGGDGGYSSVIYPYACTICYVPTLNRVTTGGNGESGAEGADGQKGSGGAAPTGAVDGLGHWQGEGGGAGQPGDHGLGGGGGGAGGGVDVYPPDPERNEELCGPPSNPDRGLDSLGGSGGGAGAGGCRGEAGQGGGAGGAAFGIFVWFSSQPLSLPVIEDNAIRSGFGGEGGRGGSGGVGGVGGAGGTGGVEGAGLSDDVWCTGAGGDGGRGGNGGHGGGGGGGTGGASYGLFLTGQGSRVATWDLTNTFLSGGAAGDGGDGGSAFLGTLTGDDGVDGAFADHNL